LHRKVIKSFSKNEIQKLFRNKNMNTYFILSVVTIVSGILILAMKICFASKCQSVRLCWGGIVVKRDVEIEDSEFKDDGKYELGSIFKQKQSEK
jgi:hypothetical protein